jgi:hypothetical protein
VDRENHSVLHRLGLERSETSGNLRPRADGPLGFFAGVNDFCNKNPVPAFALSAAESVGRAWMELACSQNRFLTLGTRIGRELLLLLLLREQHSEQRTMESEQGSKGARRPKLGTRMSRVLWACKEAALLCWLENVGGICKVRAPEPLRKNAVRAVVGRAMRLWGQDVVQRIIHGPQRARSRFSLGRLSRITTVLSSACAGAGIGACGAGALGADAPDAALAATACASVLSAGAIIAISKVAAQSGSGAQGYVLSAADANALLLGASFIGVGLVGGRYGVNVGRSKLGGVMLAGSFCQGCDFDGFVNPYPSAIFGQTHEDKMSILHMLLSAPFSMTDCLLGCMGFMPASVRLAMKDPRVQAVAQRGGVQGALQAHSLGTLEARLLKANMAWTGSMVLMSPPPPFGWEEGTVRTCGRFDPICSGPLMSVAKHMLQAPVSYKLDDISKAEEGVVHARPKYTQHMSMTGCYARHLAGLDAG